MDDSEQARGVRTGEELPVDRLDAYVRKAFPELSGPLMVRQYPSGHSNLTYYVRVGAQELILRRPPFGTSIKSAHDMSREYLILSHVRTVYDKVPRTIAYCGDSDVIGAPFYLMERVPGIVLRRDPPPGLDLTPKRMYAFSNAVVDNLAAIHALDYAAAGLAGMGRPDGYAERQVRGWTERYAHARTEDISSMERVARWLADHLPPRATGSAALIHNDYKYDNLVLDGTNLGIRAVLDWEMATIGDPLMDLGTTLGYWIEANDPEEMQGIAFCLTMLPGNLTRDQVVARYARASGRDVSNVRFYYVYALFKIAVIVQQIFRRWKEGHSNDPRFEHLIVAVRVLSGAAEREINR